MKKFIILHNLLEVDKYVFPGYKTGIFYRPEQWPEKVLEELSVSENLAKKYSLKLLKGEINVEEELTKLEVEAESAYVIQRFYDDWGVKLCFLKIEECEICAESLKETNVETNEMKKDAIEKGNLPLFKANKLMKEIEKCLENLKKHSI